MSDPAETNGTAGITEEDEREIRLEIERVAGENRITVSEELFDFTPVRNGAVFPVLVNVIGLAVLAGGVFLLAQIFAGNDAELRSSSEQIVTAESRLIEEIRRETEAELAAKEAEIAEIQQQLASISEERAALAADIESQIAQREAQLRAEFESELEAERERLRGLNLSEAEIEERLAEFAQAKEEEYETRLGQFRRETEAQREQLEAELNQLEQQFNQTLDDANAARRQLEEESAARLAAMQSEFQEELAASEAQLSQAEAELSRLAREQERTELVRSQIRGLYAAVNEALAARELQAARDRLRDLRTLLNEESVLRIPALREQRPTELFVVASIERLIGLEERFGNPDTVARLNDAALIQQVADLAARAEAAVAAGDVAGAEALYRQALGVIPAVSESWQFLGSQTDAAGAAERAAINQAAEQVAVRGRDALAASEWLTAVDEYTNLLQNFAQSRFRQEAVVGIREAVSSLEEQSREAEIALLDQISVLEADATTLRLTVSDLETALAAERTQLATTRTELGAVREQLAAAEAREAALASTLSDEESQATALAAERERLAAEREQLTARVTSLETELETTENDLADTLNELAEAQAAATRAESTIRTLRSDLAAAQSAAAAPSAGADAGAAVLDPETEAELAALRTMEADLAAAQDAYAAYRREAQQLAGSTGAAGVAGSGAGGASGASVTDVLSARVAMERFMTSEAMREWFPGMADEVSRFDDAFLASGRENAFLDVADLLSEISFTESAAERRALLDEARASLGGGAAAGAAGGGGGNAALNELIAELEAVLIR